MLTRDIEKPKKRDERCIKDIAFLTLFDLIEFELSEQNHEAQNEISLYICILQYQEKLSNMSSYKTRRNSYVK